MRPGTLAASSPPATPTPPPPPLSRRWHVTAAVIAVVALVWRLVYIVVAKRGEPLVGDQIFYSAQASVIADGRWFEHPFLGIPAADHPPLTSLVLAPVSFGDDPVMLQRVTMAVFGAVAVWLVARLGAEVGGPRVGIVAGVIAAGYGAFWLNDALVMSETLSTVCLAAMLLAAYRFRRRSDVASAAILGAAIGITALARSEALAFVVLLGVPLTLVRRWGAVEEWRERWVRAAVLAAMTVAMIAPWTIYNATRFERPVLLSTNEGLLIAGTNCDDVWRGDGIGFWSLQCGLEVPVPADADQSEQSAILRRAGLEYLRENFTDLPPVILARQARVWGVWQIDGMSWLNQGEGRERALSNLTAIQFLVLAPLAAVGAVIARRQRRFLLPLAMTFVLVTAVVGAFYGIVRFRLPADIAVVVLAAIAVEAGWSRLVERRSGSAIIDREGSGVQRGVDAAADAGAVS